MNSKPAPCLICLITLTALSALTLIISCKKENEVPDPVVPFPLPELTTPAALSQSNPCMLAAGESSANPSFPAYTMFTLGSSLSEEAGEGMLGPFKEIGETLFEIYDYEHTEQRFDEIDQSLDDIKDQISDLSGQIDDIGKQLNIDVDELKSTLHSMSLNTQIGYVTTAMEDLQGFVDNASLYSQDPQNPTLIAMMDSMKSEELSWATDMYHNLSETSMGNVVEAMKQQISPSLGSGGDNALSAYANVVVDLGYKSVSDSATAMYAYKLLECYFLTVVNYQLQAATVQKNVYSLIDSTGILQKNKTFWKNHMSPVLIAEADNFLTTVDYLVVNLEDYRSQSVFEKDMQYRRAGVAPNRMFYHILARAQFIHNLMYAAAGAKYPVIAGHLILPDKYPADPEGEVTVTVGSNSHSSAPVVYSSVLPYTFWESETCKPDYNWNVYHFGTPDSDQTFPSGAQQIKVNDNVNDAPWADTPWLHSTEITGSVKALFYNPSNPGQTSETKTDECTFQFGFFAGSWPWGNMLLSGSKIDDQSKKVNPFDFSPFNDNLGIKKINPPFAGTSNKYYSFFLQGTDITLTNDDRILGSFLVSGNTSYTSYFYVISDGYYRDVTTGSDLPPEDGSIEAFAWYSAGYGMAGLGGSDLTVRIGTSLTNGNYPYGTAHSVGGELVSTNWHNVPGQYNSEVKNITLAKGTSYSAGIQYYYQTYNLPSRVTASLKLSTAYQFVYKGYNEPQ